MIGGRTGVVVRRVLRQIARDRRTLAMLVMQPLIIMAVFGYAFGGEVRDARVAVANLDRGTLGQDVLDHLDREEVALTLVASAAEVEDAMREGRVTVGVVIPVNFTRNLESGTSRGGGETAFLTIYQDNTNPQVTAAAQAAFADAFAEALEARFDREPAFEFDERVVYGEEDPRSLEFFVPGIAAFSIFQLGSLLTVVSIVKERTLGTLPRLLASPIRRHELVLGYATAFGLFSVVQASAVLGVATLVFRVPVRGSLPLALAVTTLVGVVALGFGILVSGLAKSEFQAVQAIFLVSFPNLFLAGIFAPVEAMPEAVRPFSRMVPLTYAADALRAIINRGAGGGTVAAEILVLAGFAAAFLAGAMLLFGRRR